jgi:hypothetical protein
VLSPDTRSTGHQGRSSRPRFDFGDYKMNAINVATFHKPGHQFVFVFDDQNRSETLRQVSRFASNPDVPFTWFDAVIVCRKIRDAKHQPQRIK